MDQRASDPKMFLFRRRLEMEMEILFPGGKRVDSKYKGFVVKTDQPKSEGGDGSAPEPYDLMLSALGTCAGVNVLYFCESRKIPAEGIRVSMQVEKNEKTHLAERLQIRIQLPGTFPEKYRGAIRRAADLCAVKRTFASPPEINLTLEG
jgi:putative redox protein